jgi:hypothetical protein
MLALDLAEKILGVSLENDAQAKQVIDKFIANLEMNSAKSGKQ